MDMRSRRRFLKEAAAGLAAIPGGFACAAGLTAEEGAPVKIPKEGLLSAEEIAYLKRWDAPTIANAIERARVRRNTEGFLPPRIRPQFPELGPMVGYAVTATIRASEPRRDGRYVDRFEYYEYILSLPEPRVMVIHDLDAPNPVGSFWGEVHGSLHRALGCVGVITDGGVRDLGPVRAMRFHYFAAEVLVSHAYVHLVDFGKPVPIAGVEVKPGALLFGDEHGVVEIPHAIAKKVGDLCYEVYRSERPVIDFYHSPDFSLEKLKEFVRKRRG